MIALSELPAIKAKDADGCNAYLAKIKQRYPGFISFLVVDINGLVLQRDRRSQALDRGRETYLADVLRTGNYSRSLRDWSQTGRNNPSFRVAFLRR